MRISSRWFLVHGLTALAFLALPACVEGTSSSTATAPSEAVKTTATTPSVPATPPTRVVIPPPATATAIPTAPTTIPSSPPAAGAAGLVGTWESAACGDRTYPRRITFVDATTFSAEDLVSPCPKGAACIWSGILNHKGTYTIEKDVVTLRVETASAGPKKVQFPTSLKLDPSGAPIEAGSDGKACPYRHAGADKRP